MALFFREVLWFGFVLWQCADMQVIVLNGILVLMDIGHLLARL